MDFNAAHLDGFPSIEDILNIPLSNFISLVANNCGFTGKTHDLIVNQVHSMFLNTETAASKDYNKNLWE